MAYNHEQLKKDALEILTNNNVFFIEQLADLMGIHKSTFYDHFPTDSDEYKEIYALIKVNKVKTKTSMWSMWYNSKNPALQISLMKLIATDSERKRLSQTYTDITTDDKPIQQTSIDLSLLSKEAKREILQQMESSLEGDDN
jgi:hypothetical protein